MNNDFEDLFLYGKDLPDDEKTDQTVHYDRIIQSGKGRKDGLVCFVINGKTTCFHPDDITIDDQEQTVTMSYEVALRRGFQ